MSSNQCTEAVDIGACGGIEATDDRLGRVVMLGLYKKGIALLLTYDEGLVLDQALHRMGQRAHQTPERKNGYHAREYGHEQRLVEIVDSESITAFEQLPYGIVTLRFHDRGFSVELTSGEAVALAEMMEKVVEHVTAKG